MIRHPDRSDTQGAGARELSEGPRKVLAVDERGDGMRETEEALFRVVHSIAGRLAGRPVPVVMDALARQLPPAPGITMAEIRRIAEEISVGRDPSGL
jgi:hypothetical protein